MYSLDHKVLLETSEHGIEDSKSNTLRWPYHKWLEGRDRPEGGGKMDRKWQKTKWIETEGRIVFRWLKMRLKKCKTEAETRQMILTQFAEDIKDKQKFVKWMQITQKQLEAAATATEPLFQTKLQMLELLRLELVPKEELPDWHTFSPNYVSKSKPGPGANVL